MERAGAFISIITFSFGINRLHSFFCPRQGDRPVPFLAGESSWWWALVEGTSDVGAQLGDVTKAEGTKWEPSPARSARGLCGCKVILAPWLGGESKWNQWPSMGQKLARPGLPASHSSRPPTPPHQDPCPLPPHCQRHLVHQLYPALHPAQQCCAGRRGPHPSGLHEEPGDGSPFSWFGTPTPLGSKFSCTLYVARDISVS